MRRARPEKIALALSDSTPFLVSAARESTWASSVICASQLIISGCTLLKLPWSGPDIALDVWLRPGFFVRIQWNPPRWFWRARYPILISRTDESLKLPAHNTRRLRWKKACRTRCTSAFRPAAHLFDSEVGGAASCFGQLKDRGGASSDVIGSRVLLNLQPGLDPGGRRVPRPKYPREYISWAIPTPNKQRWVPRRPMLQISDRRKLGHLLRTARRRSRIEWRRPIPPNRARFPVDEWRSSPISRMQIHAEGRPQGYGLFPKMGNFFTKSAWRSIRPTAGYFDKVDEHQTVRRLTIIFGLGKQSRLVGRCAPCSQFGFPIPQWNATWPGLCQVFFLPMLGGGIASGWRPMPAGCGGEYEARRFTLTGLRFDNTLSGGILFNFCGAPEAVACCAAVRPAAAWIEGVGFLYISRSTDRTRTPSIALSSHKSSRRNSRAPHHRRTRGNHTRWQDRGLR